MAGEGSSTIEFSRTCSSEDDTLCDYNSIPENRVCMESALELHQLQRVEGLAGFSDYNEVNVLVSALPDHMLNCVEVKDEIECPVVLAVREQSPHETLSFEEVTRTRDCHLVSVVLPTGVDQHSALMMERALSNVSISRDMFVQAKDLCNIANNRAHESWMKQKETASIRLWKDKNIGDVFFYQELSPLDINKKEQDDAPFTLGIQTSWQKAMLLRFGHGSAISVDATFGTSHTRVSGVFHNLSITYIVCVVQ